MFSNKKTDTKQTSHSTTLTNTTSTRRNAPSVVAAGMHILGNIRSDDFVDIDGTLEGNITCQSTTIRENGSIIGDVNADKVNVYGSVKGLIKAKAVVLHASAHVEGTIMHESLSIEDGAFVDGKFKRLDKVFIDDITPTLEEEELDAPGLSADTSDEDTDEDDLLGLEKNLRLIN